MSDDFFSHSNPGELLAILQNPERHTEINSDSLATFLFFSVYAYGATNNADLIGPLVALYHRCNTELSGENRLSIYQSIVRGVTGHKISVNAMLPFIFEESQREIVSQAVIDYVMYRPVTPDDPLAGVQEILGMIQTRTVSNSGAVLGGLLLTGDHRVTVLLANIVTSLTSAILDEMVKTQSGFLYASTIELYLDCLEQLNTKATEDRFGSLASGLVLMIQKDRTGMVLDVRRDFGLSCGAEPVQVLAQHTASDYATRVIPRMQALAKREPPPKVIPIVIEMWKDRYGV